MKCDICKNFGHEISNVTKVERSLGNEVTGPILKAIITKRLDLKTSWQDHVEENPACMKELAHFYICWSR